ncbi:MAG: hypothetical protein KAW56_00475 [Candidatus Marinimicrobia bacterium]|nr:hypothetical protein [Candidatus Neomarinimicrobiota bacterium]
MPAGRQAARGVYPEPKRRAHPYAFDSLPEEKLGEIELPMSMEVQMDIKVIEQKIKVESKISPNRAHQISFIRKKGYLLLHLNIDLKRNKE